LHSTSYNFSNQNDDNFSTEMIIGYMNQKLSLPYITGSSLDNLFKDTSILKLASNKAIIFLGWKSKLSLIQSLDLTLEYYIDSITSSAREIVLKQIRDYILGNNNGH
jgi:hypothetical protein